MTNVHEEWRPVVGYEEVYEVSDHGRVRRVKPGHGVRRLGKPLTDSRMGHNYRVVRLSDVPRRKLAHVHHLVADAFIGPRPEGLEVNHKDGDKGNNHVSNLEYVTRAENARHASEHGLLQRGSDHRNSKLTEAQVRAIRAAAGTVPSTQLARKYGVIDRTIQRIVARSRWKHVG